VDTLDPRAEPADLEPGAEPEAHRNAALHEPSEPSAEAVAEAEAARAHARPALEVLPEPEEVAPEEPAKEESRWAALYARVAPFIPWFSLVGGIVGAVWMDRRESQAPLIAAGSAASWVGLVIGSLLHRKYHHQARETGAFKKALRFTTLATNQSLVQLSLFFCAPFYVAAFVWTPLEVVFAVLFVLAVVASLWDPLTEYALLHPAWGPLLLAFSSFVAWNAVLPMLGVPHRIGVWAAAGAVSLAIPLVQVLRGVSRRDLAYALGVAVLLPLVLWLGGVRALPPAPLRVVQAAIGTHVENRQLKDPKPSFKRSPGALVCFTAIQAPMGLKDQLTHVWRHDGEITQTIPLTVKGGRKLGFRTWSRLPISMRAEGKYRCDVVTTLGQTLGGASVTIGE
jgi:hypothetical protein